MGDLNILLSFGAGLLSFISPCCLPLYPAFLSYITGVSIEELKENNGLLKKRVILHTLFFLVGFSIIFVVLGLSTSLISQLFHQYNDLIRQIGAILIIFLGLLLSGFLNFDFITKERRFTFKNRPSGYFGSVLIGFVYATGWTPCVGPVLAAVIGMSLYTGNGLLYMIAYFLGFAIPFFVLSFFIGKSNWIKKFSSKIMNISGYFMVVMGIFLYFDWLTKITTYLTTYVFNGFTGF
ncbi:cytochrome c biogenesis CcdA family protein [Bacillus sp. JJ1562]|uniref:cytochrome c biogenesis CcdA family protein n=1 Tax=Bacillus sp. JJ1562 TaxID=3122960 RepID=UPI003001FC82